jgi:transcriptional regulator with XRE-family HTH domain
MSAHEQLKSILADQGLTQSDLARRVGVDPSAICKIFLRESRPSLLLAFAIQRAVGLPAESWVADELPVEPLPEETAQ